MVVTLKPMSAEQFNSWLEVSIVEYADAKIKAGNAASDEAVELSKREFEDLLPDGLNTADTYLLTVVDGDRNQSVGMLWLKVLNERQEMFIYDIRIDEQYRGQGYGKQTMLVMETFVRGLGVPKISLHVFGDNQVALKLYESVGFIATNIRMSKVISE